MLKVKGMRDVSPGKRLFVIERDAEPASTGELERVAAIAGRLLTENELPGEFAVFDRGLLALNVLTSERTFFHDGIVFAALDAVNNPEKNPTISQPAVGDHYASEKQLRPGDHQNDREKSAQRQRHEASRSEPGSE